jgi:hypothetical protein
MIGYLESILKKTRITSSFPTLDEVNHVYGSVRITNG